MAAFVSILKRPSTEKTKGVKCFRLSWQAALYLFFLSFSWRRSIRSGGVFCCEGASVSVILTSKIV